MAETIPTSDGAPEAAPPQGPPPLRASDADRHATVHQLQDAVAQGLLSTDEGSQRMAAAYAARHLRDLPMLTADLPPEPAALQAPATHGWRPLAEQAWTQTRASVIGITAGGWRSPRALGLLAGVLAAILLVVLLGAGALDLLTGGPHGHPGLGPHH